MIVNCHSGSEKNMSKYLIIIILVFISPSYIQAQGTTENWECALDLHQGDTGTLTLERSNDKLDGVISYRRNDTNFENTVSGSWLDNKIKLKRILSTDSNEEMSGLAVVLGTKKVNIGGRYSVNYHGVWSADCDLVSEITSAEKVEPSNYQTIPSTTSRIRPNAPNDTDNIMFSALGSHPDGVKSISFYLGDNKIHTCNSDRCEFNYGQLKTGNYNWRVEATSTTGIKSAQNSNRLIVRDDADIANCTIAGSAIGQSAPLADIYLAKLYGPNNTNILISSSSFKSGRYQFSNLPTGTYQLRIDTQGDNEILASPAKTTLTCTSQATLTQNIEFR